MPALFTVAAPGLEHNHKSPAVDASATAAGKPAAEAGGALSSHGEDAATVLRHRTRGAWDPGAEITFMCESPLSPSDLLLSTVIHGCIAVLPCEKVGGARFATARP